MRSLQPPPPSPYSCRRRASKLGAPRLSYLLLAAHLTTTPSLPRPAAAPSPPQKKTKTTELLLANNAFTGDVPAQYSALANAKAIDLRLNNLTNNAGVPAWLELSE